MTSMRMAWPAGSQLEYLITVVWAMAGTDAAKAPASATTPKMRRVWEIMVCLSLMVFGVTRRA
ncbi:hypothetical protein FQZ97_1022220 [compost metagenome]